MSTMTREELLEVLNGDQTLEQIEAAMAEGELNQEEWDKICDFLRETDKEKAEQLFGDILKDIQAIPSYDNGKEAVQGWKEYRDEVAYEVKALKLQEIECAQTIARLGNEFDDINQQIKDAAGKLTQEEIDQLKETRESIEGKLQAQYKEQSDMFKRHAALDLMAVEAKDFVKQAERRIWLEQTEPVRKGIGYVFTGIKLRAEKAIDMVQELGDNLKHKREQNKNTKDLAKISDDISYHPIEKLKNWFDTTQAKGAWKDANYFKEQSAKAAEKLLKEQNKMLEKAQKLVEKQARPTFMEKLEAWSKGEKAEMKPVEKVTDYDRAQEILEQAGKWNGDKLQGYKDSIKFCDEQAKSCEQEAMSHMERVADRLRVRQQEAQDMQQTFDQMHTNDLLKHDQESLDEIQQNIDYAYNQGFIDKDSFDQDMLDMMRECGMGDVIDRDENGGGGGSHDDHDGPER